MKVNHPSASRTNLRIAKRAAAAIARARRRTSISVVYEYTRALACKENSEV
jgi:hypothetical protein